jgi:hypothetical protein
MNMEVFCKIVPLLLMKYSKMTFSEFNIFGGAPDQQILQNIEEMLFKINQKAINII